MASFAETFALQGCDCVLPAFVQAEISGKPDGAAKGRILGNHWWIIKKSHVVNALLMCAIINLMWLTSLSADILYACPV